MDRLTEDEKRERRRLKSAAWRAANKERAREITRDCERRRAAVRAIAEGRDPGRVGRPPVFTAEEKREKHNGRVKRYYQLHPENNRAAAKVREKAKRDKKAIAEGRVPGVVGHLSTLQVAELEAYMRDWSDKDKVYYFRVKAQNARAAKLGIPGELTVADMRLVAERQHGHCSFCGRPFGEETPEIDHWVPIALGGHNVRDNICLLHRRCNLTKAKKHPTVFGLNPPVETEA